MNRSATPATQAAKRELLVFAGCLLFGVLLLPVAIYLVGAQVFGDYGGDGFGGFYGGIFRGVLTGDLVTWFLVLSPYLVWQSLRWTFRLFKLAGSQP